MYFRALLYMDGCDTGVQVHPDYHVLIYRVSNNLAVLLNFIILELMLIRQNWFKHKSVDSEHNFTKLLLYIFGGGVYSSHHKWKENCENYIA